MEMTTLPGYSEGRYPYLFRILKTWFGNKLSKSQVTALEIEREREAKKQVMARKALALLANIAE
jgi:hypothetical protein